jgi:hypothetical protein
MKDAVDLFGEPLLKRSAHFPAPGIRRRLSRDWGQGRRAFVLGCNPSDAGDDREDPTTSWWNRWFDHWGFAGYDAGNLYSFVTSSPAQMPPPLRRSDWRAEPARPRRIFVNLDAVVAIAKRADRVFVCFGHIAWDREWIDHVVEAIQTDEGPWPDLWCRGTTKSVAPTHLVARGKHRTGSFQAPVLWESA